MPDWRLGTMGFGYSEWNGVFYPRGMKAGEYLGWYAQHFDAVELDTTFHAAPTADRVRHWASMTPAQFRFTVKTPRAVTHDAPLETGLATMLSFLDAVRAFGDKLGAVLLQFPPTFAANRYAALNELLGKLPTDLRYAVEFRHPSWRVSQRTADMLHHHRAAWVSADYPGDRPEVRPTTDFLYGRWIGEHDRFPEKDHEQLDMTERLEWWKTRLLAAPGIQTIYGFMNNDYSGFSIATCERFKRVIGLPLMRPQVQRDLFH